MKTNLRLHHFAHKITPQSLEICLELFEFMGCSMAYRQSKNSTWAMVNQKGTNIHIQLVEANEKVQLTEEKLSTHIAFLAADPKAEMEKIKKWAEEKEIEFVSGGWSERELWFDLPEIFVNFVVEIMDEKIIEED